MNQREFAEKLRTGKITNYTKYLKGNKMVIVVSVKNWHAKVCASTNSLNHKNLVFNKSLSKMDTLKNNTKLGHVKVSRQLCKNWLNTDIAWTFCQKAQMKKSNACSFTVRTNL